MKPSDFGRELAFPVTQPATLIPMITSWLLFSLSAQFQVYGMFLFLATLFPFFAYLMRLLEARAANRDAPTFDAELMAFFGNPSSLFPVVMVALFGWLSAWVMRVAGPEAGWLFVMGWGALLPALLSVLAVTRSPLQSINPFAIYGVIKAAAFDYLVLVIILEFIAGALIRSYDPNGSALLPSIVLMYFFFLVYSLTGAVAGRHGLAAEVEIPAPVPVTPEQVRNALASDRVKVANHAYAFASRGNRQGAFAHIEAHVANEADPGEARAWFFNNMLKWDDTEHALFYAQISLHHLLAEERDHLALKLLAQCLHANPRFRPDPKDREAAMELLERYGRDDLLKQLS